jgi:hypothetical protein
VHTCGPEDGCVPQDVVPSRCVKVVKIRRDAKWVEDALATFFAVEKGPGGCVS